MYPLLRSILFHLDPEFVHSLALVVLKNPLARAIVCENHPAPQLPVSLWGLTFRNPIGLAAGFDKDGEAISAWDRLGFGYCELGTITFQAQPGNPKPRIFRYPADQALVNRMGFPNEGAERIAERVIAERKKKERPGFPVGINIGKSKVVPNEKAAEDYVSCLTVLKDVGDFFVVNVSSPNTPGLRELQSPRMLEPILTRLKSIAAGKPLLVKIAPDLSNDEIREITDLALRVGLAGIVATNTTIRHDMPETGGLSGRPLAERSNEVIRTVKAVSKGRLPIIGMGGVFDRISYLSKIEAGATLVQLYTGFIYQGPTVVYDILS